MSKFTKQAIVNCFIELSEEMPIEKITVTAITNRCGINRNTFYYHYQDIYALLEEIIYTKCEKLFVCDYEDLENSWKSTLRFIGQYAKSNEEFIKSIYQSMPRDAFEDYMADVSYSAIYNTIVYGVRKAFEEGLEMQADAAQRSKRSSAKNLQEDATEELLPRKKSGSEDTDKIAREYEPEIKEAAHIFSRFFAQIAVDWVRGKNSKNPAEIMEDVIETFQGVPEVIIRNILRKKGCAL